ncbi:hypothetical protein WA588_002313 [Blastocystis sp. NMH]
MSETLNYFAVEPQSKSYPSYGDIVNVMNNRNRLRAQVISVQQKNDSVTVKLDNVNSPKVVNRKLIQIAEKYTDRVGIRNIAVEVNDIVTVTYEAQIFKAVVTRVFPKQKSVEVLVMSSKMMDTKIQLPVERIRFFARGLVVFKPQTATVQANPLPSPQSRTIEAIMVDAPCVVKVVPLNEEPDNYDDLMAVTFHEGSNESPKILPLIRVKCGTILCVRAPPSSDNASDTSSVDLSSRRWHSIN